MSATAAWRELLDFLLLEERRTLLDLERAAAPRCSTPTRCEPRVSRKRDRHLPEC